MKNTKYDLVMVGSSFASTFFLYKYLQKAPKTAKILVLERGFLFPHQERVKERRGELSEYAALNEKFEDTFQNNTPEKKWLFQTGFGGSSNCWYGCTPRFMPNDFRLKSLYGVAQDWPISYDDLETYYCEVEDIMAISGPDETPFPKSKKYPLPPHLFTEFDKMAKERYGNLYINQPTARARVATKGRGVCCASAVCSVCPVNAKFTIENSQMGVYEDERVELLYGAQVYALDIQNNVVKSVLFEQNKKEQQAHGEIIAIGANPIFNSNILLNSKDKNPLTGRGIGEQFGISADLYLDNVNTLGGSTWVNANGYMLYDGMHRKDQAAILLESSNFPYMRVERGKWRNIANLRVVFEDLPDDNNRVTPTENKFKPQLTHKGHSSYVQKAIDNLEANLTKVFSGFPIEQIKIAKNLYHTEAHVLGTTRMSKDPADGVVDQHLMHHNYRNLFVLGASTFTTYTPANPTLTLSALSLRAADKSF